jgi:hypothetical protein
MGGKMILLYILEDKKAVACDDAIPWAIWMESHRDERRVAETMVGETKISTVFLGVDMSPFVIGRPHLFETMTFGGGEWNLRVQMRYSTWEEAEAGHEEIVRQVKADKGE